MPRGERLFRFLASLMVRGSYGIVTIRFEAGKVTHVETQTRRAWQYKDLPEDVSKHSCAAAERQTAPGK